MFNVFDMVKWKRVPLGLFSDIQIFPSCRLTMRLQMDKPTRHSPEIYGVYLAA